MSEPRLTVFTSTVYPDIVRVWNACIRDSFAGEDIRVEIFSDAEPDRLEPGLVPGAEVLRRTALRRDFHDAYNDAVERARTPYLAFVDTDVFWLSREVWPRALQALARPEVAAVSCVSRKNSVSHGTFAVIMKADIYRTVVAAVPGGFYPSIEGLDPSRPSSEWKCHDTGDRVSRGVVAAGYEVRLLNLEDEGAFVRFNGLTLTRKALDWIGRENFLREARTSDYHWSGLAGNGILKGVHDRLFPGGPPFGFPFGPAEAAARALAAGPYPLSRRVWILAQLSLGAHRIRRSLARPVRRAAPSRKVSISPSRRS